ncbi:putative Pectin lyase fold/virulence factor [Seiridium unicorne]|uniref:Pectin lyase fold/virulence factor n=1 Tax=Seiridium unicorne TaxID=138068 RepID=A0ABR2UV42_9PEZI
MHSENVLLEDITVNYRLGLAFGIGQYIGQYETIGIVVVRSITSNKTLHTAYFNTWTGEQVSCRPNGGGGATDGWKSTYFRDAAVSISQCTTFSGTGDCNSSKFQLKGINVKNISGSNEPSYITNLQCSEDSGGYTDIDIENVDWVDVDSGDELTRYKCSNVVDPTGFDW